VSIDRFQSALNTVKGYYSTWRIKLNPSKTQAVSLTKRRTRELPAFNLSLDGNSIPWSARAKYLGLILDKKLKFSPFSPLREGSKVDLHFVPAYQWEVHSFSGPKGSSL
jgi:hypothetical protein